MYEKKKSAGEARRIIFLEDSIIIVMAPKMQIKKEQVLNNHSYIGNYYLCEVRKRDSGRHNTYAAD